MADDVTRQLCSIQDAAEHVPGLKAGSTSAQPKLERLVNGESAYMHSRARREFTPRATNPQTRRFHLTEDDVAERLVLIGDLGSSTGLTVKLKDLAGTVLETVASANYVLLPEDREPWQPYGEIWFPIGVTAPASLALGYVLELAGTFGYPAIPEDLRQECARNVAAKYVRASPVSEQLGEEAGAQRIFVSYRITDSHRDRRF